MFVKVCGCTRPEDAAAAAEAGAAAVGMILSPGYRRTLDAGRARRLRAAVPAGVWAVGVFVARPLDEVLEAVAALRLDAVQLHGGEPDAYCARVRAACPLIRGWTGRGAPPSEADLLLAEPHVGRGGGHGEAWDWAVLAGVRAEVPLVLSGGLTPENVAAACARVRPWGVDVSSGVETAGAKDPVRIAAFCAAVRAWEAEAGAGAAGAG